MGLARKVQRGHLLARRGHLGVCGWGQVGREPGGRVCGAGSDCDGGHATRPASDRAAGAAKRRDNENGVFCPGCSPFTGGVLWRPTCMPFLFQTKGGLCVRSVCGSYRRSSSRSFWCFSQASPCAAQPVRRTGSCRLLLRGSPSPTPGNCRRPSARPRRMGCTISCLSCMRRRSAAVRCGRKHRPACPCRAGRLRFCSAQSRQFRRRRWRTARRGWALMYAGR